VHCADDANHASAARATACSDCDIGPVARYMYQGNQVLFVCKPGYTVIGNTTWTCTGPSTQYQGASLTCLSQPPVPMLSNFTLAELAKNNSYVGTVFATPANLDQTLSYALVAQYPRNANNTPAFTISEWRDVAAHAVRARCAPSVAVTQHASLLACMLTLQARARVPSASTTPTRSTSGS